MKTSLLIFALAVSSIFAAGEITVTEDGHGNFEVYQRAPDGNVVYTGRLVDGMKGVHKTNVQVKVNEVLAAKAAVAADTIKPNGVLDKTIPLSARVAIDAAKAAGAVVEAATEAKVVSAEKDRDLIADIGEVTVSCRLANGVWTVTSPGKQTLILEETDPLIVNILNCAQFALNRDGRLLAWSYKNGKIGIILTVPEEIKKFLEWDAQTSIRINELYAALTAAP